MRTHRLVLAAVCLALSPGPASPFGSHGDGRGNSLVWELPCDLHFHDGLAYQHPPKRHQCEYMEALAARYPKSVDDFNAYIEQKPQLEALKRWNGDADLAFETYQKEQRQMMDKTAPAAVAEKAPKARMDRFMALGKELKKFLDERPRSEGGRINWKEAYLTRPTYRRELEDRLKELETSAAAEVKDLDKAERAKFAKLRKGVFEPDKVKTPGGASRLAKRGEELKKAGTGSGAAAVQAKIYGERGGDKVPATPHGASAGKLSGRAVAGGVIGDASRYSSFQSGKDMRGNVPGMTPPPRAPKAYDAVMFYEPDGLIKHAAAGVILPDGRVVRQDAAILGVRPPIVYKNLDEAKKNMSKEFPNAEVVILPRTKQKDGKYSGEKMLEYMDKPRGEFANTPYCSSYAATVLREGGYDVNPAIFGSGVHPITLRNRARTLAKRLEAEESKEEDALVASN